MSQRNELQKWSRIKDVAETATHLSRRESASENKASSQMIKKIWLANQINVQEVNIDWSREIIEQLKIPKCITASVHWGFLWESLCYLNMLSTEADRKKRKKKKGGRKRFYHILSLKSRGRKCDSGDISMIFVNEYFI